MTSLFKPPLPVLITGGGGGGGTAIINTTSSVVATADETTGNSSVEITTADKIAVIIDRNQNVVIGGNTTLPSKKLTVSAPFGQCIQLINETSGGYSNLITNADGGLTITTTGSNVQFGSNKIYIGAGSLHIGSEAVVATAAQINYLTTTPGIAVALKALVVDSGRNISNINSLSATSLTGTIRTGNQPDITGLNSVNISNLSLGGFTVLSTATELNYLRGVIAGQVRADRALVVDVNKNLGGLNSLQSTYLSGIIQTSSQPNITSIGILDSLSVNGFIGVGTVSPQRPIDILSSTPSIRFGNGTNSAELSIDGSGNLRVSPTRDITIASHKNLIFSGSSSIIGLDSLYVSTITGTLQTSYQPNITSIGTLTSLDISGDVVIGRISSVANSQRLIVNEQNGECLKLVRSSVLLCSLTVNGQGDLEINPTRDIRIPSGKSIRMAGPIIGVSDLYATTLTGTIQTAYQPNITTIGTLTNLVVNNRINAVAVIASDLTGTIQTAAQPNITSIGTLSSLTVSNAISASSVSATTLSGTLQTSDQPNIISIGTLSSLTVSNAILAGSVSASTLSGTLQTHAQPNITSIGTLTSLTVSNAISAGSVSASTLSGTLQTAAQPNITSIGTLISLTVSDIISASSVSASTLSGTLQTAAQPNITSIGTLSSLTVLNTISADSVSVSTLLGTLQTTAQPNITSIGILDRLLTNGPIGIGVSNPTSAININTSGLSIDPCIHMSNGVINASICIGENGIDINTTGEYVSLGLDVGLRFTGGTMFGLSSMVATEITGTLQTAAQPNITSIGTLTYLDTEFIGVGVEHSNQYRLNMFHESGKMIMMSDGESSFIVSVVNGNYTFNTSTDRIDFGHDVDLAFNGGTIIGLDNLSANTISGLIQTAYQPNITTIGTLESLTVSEGISASNAVFESAHITGDLIVDGEITLSTPLSFTNLSSSTGLFNANIPATSATSGGTLTVTGGAAFSQNVVIGTTLTVGGTTITGSSISALSGATPGVVTPNVFLSADSNKNLSSFNTLSAINFNGTIQTAYQPNITTIGNLTNLNVCGYLGVGTKSPMKQLEINSTTGDCLRLSFNKPTNNAFMDVSIDTLGNAIFAPNGGILTINGRLVGSQITLGNTTNSIMPLEIGSTPFVMTQPYAFNLSNGSRGTVNPIPSTYVSYNYSIRALGRILCTQSLDVMSDRRTKKNINELTDKYCTSFIEKTTPVNFNWIEGDENKSFGYIAQELLREGFHDLVNLVRDDQVKEEVDEDGFISPKGVKFTITYDYIIPILAKNQKRLMKENTELKAKLDLILEMLQHK